MVRDIRFREYSKEEFEVIKENKDLKLVKCTNGKYRFLNQKNVERRNFSFNINDYDRDDYQFMEFILNQEDFSKTMHLLALKWIKENGSGNIKLDRYGNLIDEQGSR